MDRFTLRSTMTARGAAVALLVALVAPSLARAEKLVLACQEDDIKGGATAPPLGQTITIDTASPASVEVKAPYGTIRLPATVRKNEVAMQVSASGPAKARMPARKDVDACLAKGKPQPAGQPVDVWAAQTCRLHADSTPEAVAVDVTVEITILEGDVTTTIERRYAGDDASAVERYAMPSRPTCRVESRK